MHKAKDAAEVAVRGKFSTHQRNPLLGFDRGHKQASYRGALEPGRTILETIFVIVLVCILSIGSILLYQYALNLYKANQLYNQIRIEAASRLNRGAGNSHKGIADTSWGPRDAIQVEDNCPHDAFSVKMKDVDKKVCQYLLDKTWKKPLDPIAFYHAEGWTNLCEQEAHTITTDGYYMTGKDDCADGTLAVVFGLNNKAEEVRTCQNDHDCYSCQECGRKHICVNKTSGVGACGVTQRCTAQGCITALNCDFESEYILNGECEDCPENATCDGEEFFCENGYYKEGNACAVCPSPEESCSINEDIYDETTDCITTQAISCSGNTPVCGEEGACQCPENATCEGGEFSCENGYYKAGNACEACPAPTTSCLVEQDETDENGCITTRAITCSGNKYVCGEEGACQCPALPTKDESCNDECGCQESLTCSQGICVCSGDKPYWDDVNGVCRSTQAEYCSDSVPCSDPSTQVCNNGICQTCESDKIPNEQGTECVCPEGSRWNEQTQSCSDCEEGWGKTMHWWIYEFNKGDTYCTQSSCKSIPINKFNTKLETAPYCSQPCLWSVPKKGYFCSDKSEFPISKLYVYGTVCPWDSATNNNCIGKESDWFPPDAWDGSYHRISEVSYTEKFVKSYGRIAQLNKELPSGGLESFCQAIGGRTLDPDEFVILNKNHTNGGFVKTNAVCYDAPLNNKGKNLYKEIGEVHFVPLPTSFTDTENILNNSNSFTGKYYDVYLGSESLHICRATSTRDDYRICYLGGGDITCPPNSSVLGSGAEATDKGCYCNENTPVWNGSSCVSCSEKTVPNNDYTACVSCPAGKTTYNNKECVCQPGCSCNYSISAEAGYYWDGTTCQLCPENTIAEKAGATRVEDCKPCTGSTITEGNDRTTCNATEALSYSKYENNSLYCSDGAGGWKVLNGAESGASCRDGHLEFRCPSGKQATIYSSTSTEQNNYISQQISCYAPCSSGQCPSEYECSMQNNQFKCNKCFYIEGRRMCSTFI